MKNTPHYVYIASYLKETVTDSQIINWLELLKQQHIIFDLVLISGLRDYFNDRKMRKLKVEQAHKTLSSKIYQLFSIKPQTSLGQIIIFMILLFIFLKDIFLRRMIIIQTRTSANLNAIRLLKAAYPKLRIVFDSRGAAAEEIFLTQNKINNGSYTRDCDMYAKNLKREIEFVNLSDKLFCISNKLKKYHLCKNNKLDESKIVVIPGCADSNGFYWNIDIRNAMRYKLGVTDKFVFVYSGMLNQVWQTPESIFYIFSELSSHYSKLYLMCLTPNTDIVYKYMRKHGINKEKIWSNYVKYDSLINYLCAADVGFLLRENTLINNVASPTKFAEYIMCGLPVIISEGIGDFSDFVKDNHIGLVIKNSSERIVKEFETNFLNSYFDRNRIANIGKANFSKQKYLDKIIDVYKNLSI